MSEKLRILLLEDTPEDVALLEYRLTKDKVHYESRVVDTREEFETELAQFRPDVVISDHSLPQFNSLKALEIYNQYRREQNASAAFILVTGTVSEEFAVKVIQNGADDYILKDRLKRLSSAITHALEKNRLREQRRKIEEEKLYLLGILQKSLHEIFVFDPHNLRFEYANDEALRNLGFRKEELMKMDPTQILTEFSLDTFKKALIKVIKSKKGKIYETYAKRKDGSQYPVQVHLQVVEQGREQKFLANVLDISESKELEKQAQLASFIQEIFSQNHKLEKSLEIILEELCRKPSLCAAEIWAHNFEQTSIKSFAYYDRRKRLSRGTAREIAQKVFETGEMVVADADPSQKDHFTTVIASPIRSGKNIEAVIQVFSDSPWNKKECSQALGPGVQDKLAVNIKRKKTEEELQKIFELSPDVLAVVGKDGYFKKVNPSFGQILGLSEEEILSMPFEDLVHQDDLQVLESWKDLEQQKDEVSFYESRWRTSRGEYRWFSWSVTPFLEEEDLSFAVGKDITAFKDHVRAIKMQNEKLAEIAWEQSHVVRAPLARIMSCIAFLRENNEHKEMILESLENSAHELDAIIKKIVNKAERIKNV